MKTIRKIVGLFFALLLGAGGAVAQTYPSNPIKIIVSYPPGGGTDVNVRVLTPKLSEVLGQPIIIENKPGAAARLGPEFVAKSAPDGYTLLAGTSGEMVFNVGLFPSLGYDPERDFTPITLFNYDPMMFAVNPSFPAESIRELITVAKAKPDQVFHASAASAFQVAVEYFNKQAGVKIIHVPYKGAAPALTATVSGQTSLVVLSIPPLRPHVKSGKLRPLAFTGAKRSPFYPDVPTLLESGLDFEGVSWAGLFAPAGTPSAIIDKLYLGLTVVLKDKEVNQRLTAMGRDTSTIGVTPTEFKAILHRDLVKWPEEIRGFGIKGG